MNNKDHKNDIWVEFRNATLKEALPHSSPELDDDTYICSNEKERIPRARQDKALESRYTKVVQSF